MRWAAAELHAHTLHSDGKQTPEALMAAAQAKGLEFIALTDHNTSSGIGGLPFLPGMEWTTYQGHMTVLGARNFIDWRLAGPGALDPLLLQIRQAEGVAVIAHPRGVGSPVCTGCRWEHRVLDYALAAGMEVWHKDRPWARLENELSLKLWQGLLDEGFRIAAVSGLDWHRPGEERYAAVTMLGVEGDASHANALKAIRQGRTLVTAGPLPTLSLEKDKRSYGIGDSAPAGHVIIHMGFDSSDREPYWADANIQVQAARLVGRGGKIIHEQAFIGQDSLGVEQSLAPGWLSLELWGLIDGAPQRIALTSPIYIDYPTMITAHTGAMGTAVNHLDGLIALLDAGVDAVEADVRRNEGRLCLSHDVPPPGSSCPSLEDCLSLLNRRPQVRMNLDLKQPGLSGEALKLARECGVASRLMYTGDVSAEELPMILENEIPLWYNQYILPQEERHDPLTAIRRRGLHTLNIDRKQVTDELLKSGAGYLSVWTVNEEDELRRLLEAKVRNITTNQPDLALRLRREIQGR